MAIKQPSRQRQWQIRKRRQGRCTICGKKPLETTYYCKKHAAANRARALRRYYEKREAEE